MLSLRNEQSILSLAAKLFPTPTKTGCSQCYFLLLLLFLAMCLLILVRGPDNAMVVSSLPSSSRSALFSSYWPLPPKHFYERRLLIFVRFLLVFLWSNKIVSVLASLPASSSGATWKCNSDIAIKVIKLVRCTLDSTVKWSSLAAVETDSRAA